MLQLKRLNQECLDLLSLFYLLYAFRKLDERLRYKCEVHQQLVDLVVGVRHNHDMQRHICNIYLCTETFSNVSIRILKVFS
jgi:hypothetical protein